MHFDAFSAVTGDKHNAFRHTLHEIHERIKMFVLVKTKY
ncbi:ArsR family transcriptional regulator [Pseudomonas putida]|nr:ArsR family transcriptional regulator [Pseudomonas putida]